MLLQIKILICFLTLCHALYFHMGETEKKCFIEEIPDETMITGLSNNSDSQFDN